MSKKDKDSRCMFTAEEQKQIEEAAIRMGESVLLVECEAIGPIETLEAIHGEPE